MSVTSAPSPRRENVARGTALAALVIPAAILLSVLMWSSGFFISILFLLLVVGAILLYLKGGGGGMGVLGASIVSVLVVVGLLLGYFAGVLMSVAGSMASVLGVQWWTLLVNAGFWPPFFENLPRFVDESSTKLYLAVAVSVVGVFLVFYLRAKVLRPRPKPVLPVG